MENNFIIKYTFGYSCPNCKTTFPLENSKDSSELIKLVSSNTTIEEELKTKTKEYYINDESPIKCPNGCKTLFLYLHDYITFSKYLLVKLIKKSEAPLFQFAPQSFPKLMSISKDNHFTLIGAMHLMSQSQV